MSPNIEVTEYTGNVSLQLGNADLAESCAWEPPMSTERAPLPGHEHLAGVEWEPLPKPKWLTENRSFAIAGALAAVGVYLGVLA